jgi:colanic acid biosynthesis glycosyl transferase WcaI
LGAFDKVSTISPQMIDRLASKGVDAARTYELRNWAAIDLVQPLSGPSSFREEWAIRTPHVALYSGNIANKQGIELVLDAARSLQRRTDLTFVVCGEGPNRQRLIEASQGLSNIIFRDLQPRERLSDLLGLATIHLLPQLAGAADLVLPSKLTNMLASGRPVVATAAAGTALAAEVERCGLVTVPGSASEFAQAIEQLIDTPDLAAEFGRCARNRAEQHWSRQAILDRLALQIEKLAIREPR